jgi:hypothetical protein
MVAVAVMLALGGPAGQAVQVPSGITVAPAQILPPAQWLPAGELAVAMVRVRLALVEMSPAAPVAAAAQAVVERPATTALVAPAAPAERPLTARLVGPAVLRVAQPALGRTALVVAAPAIAQEPQWPAAPVAAV